MGFQVLFCMKTTSLLALALTSFSVLSTSSASAISLSFLPSTQVVNQGDSVAVELVISGLGNQTAPSLGVFDLNVDFNPSLISLSQVTFGNGLNLGNSGGSSSTASMTIPGSINLFEFSLQASEDLNNLQPATFPLAQLVFDTVGIGTSLLELSPPSGLSEILLGDADGIPLILSSSFNGSITINPSATTIPESSSSWGIIGIGVLLLKLKFPHRIYRKINIEQP